MGKTKKPPLKAEPKKLKKRRLVKIKHKLRHLDDWGLMEKTAR
jgi:hypothetical protein